jgi:hypothetical protein
VAGPDNREITATLTLSVRTVERHRQISTASSDWLDRPSERRPRYSVRQLRVHRLRIPPRLFATMKPYAPRPRPGAQPPSLWGNENHVRSCSVIESSALSRTGCR